MMIMMMMKKTWPRLFYGASTKQTDRIAINCRLTGQRSRVELDVDRVRFGFLRHKTNVKHAAADHSNGVRDSTFVDHYHQLAFARFVHVHFTRTIIRQDETRIYCLALLHSRYSE